MANQDRALWNADAIAEGVALTSDALPRGSVGHSDERACRAGPVTGLASSPVVGAEACVPRRWRCQTALMRRLLRENGLSVVVIAAFLAIWLGGQTVAGLHTYNSERRLEGESQVSFARYLTTAHFGEATFENWESEFLQMGMYVVLTVKLRQRGSAESKPLDESSPQDERPEDHRSDATAPWPVRRGGAWVALYKHSLSLALLALFVTSLVLHAATGSRVFNGEQLSAGAPDRVSTWTYLFRSQFWFESLQNWQSEFLAVGVIVTLTIHLREHGSPESKPVHAAHSETGT